MDTRSEAEREAGGGYRRPTGHASVGFCHYVHLLRNASGAESIVCCCVDVGMHASVAAAVASRRVYSDGDGLA